MTFHIGDKLIEKGLELELCYEIVDVSNTELYTYDNQSNPDVMNITYAEYLINRGGLKHILSEKHFI